MTTTMSRITTIIKVSSISHQANLNLSLYSIVKAKTLANPEDEPPMIKPPPSEQPAFTNSATSTILKHQKKTKTVTEEELSKPKIGA